MKLSIVKVETEGERGDYSQPFTSMGDGQGEGSDGQGSGVGVWSSDKKMV